MAWNERYTSFIEGPLFRNIGQLNAYLLLSVLQDCYRIPIHIDSVEVSARNSTECQSGIGWLKRFKCSQIIIPDPLLWLTLQHGDHREDVWHEVSLWDVGVRHPEHVVRDWLHEALKQGVVVVEAVWLGSIWPVQGVSVIMGHVTWDTGKVISLKLLLSYQMFLHDQTCSKTVSQPTDHPPSESPQPRGTPQSLTCPTQSPR